MDMSIYDFANIPKLPPNGCLPATLGIDFNDTIQSANFEIVCSLGKPPNFMATPIRINVLGNFTVCVKPTIGELIRPIKMENVVFYEKQSKLGGMNEHVGHAKCVNNVTEKVLECTNLGVCGNPDGDTLR